MWIKHIVKKGLWCNSTSHTVHGVTVVCQGVNKTPVTLVWEEKTNKTFGFCLRRGANKNNNKVQRDYNLLFKK